MNIIFDAGFTLDDSYRAALEPLLSAGSSPLRLDASNAKADGTLDRSEKCVFLTDLPVDVMKYHSDFFAQNNDIVQWFIILCNRDGQGLYDLIDAARKHGLKNCRVFNAKNVDELASIVHEINVSRNIQKGKTLLFSKRKLDFVFELAELLFGDDSECYEIQIGFNCHADNNFADTPMIDTDAEHIILCGERAGDFRNIRLREGCEPYFVIDPKADPRAAIDSELLKSRIAGYFKLTCEQVESHMFFIDTKPGLWLDSNRPERDEAVKFGILLYDRFGLPLSRYEYTSENIIAAASASQKTILRLKDIVISGT